MLVLVQKLQGLWRFRAPRTFAKILFNCIFGFLIGCWWAYPSGWRVEREGRALIGGSLAGGVVSFSGTLTDESAREGSLLKEVR